MKDAVLLSFTPDADVRAVGEAADAAGCALMLCGPGEAPSRGSLPRERPLVLLAVGPEGGASLARWVAEFGLDGVAGVGLVGVTAPWAERGACYGEWLGGSGGHKRWKRCGSPADYVSSFDADDADPEPLCQKHFAALNPNVRDMWKPARVLLGPLEPLRAVAERALGVHAGGDADDCRTERCAACAGRSISLVVACAPDDGVCRCLDMGGPRVPWDDCCLCDGTGKALSSADVARELCGAVDGQFGAHGDPLSSYQWESGGLVAIFYERGAALAEHGLRAVVERLLA